MASPEEVISEGIAEILQEPARDFSKYPLTQLEIHSVIEMLTDAVNDPQTSEELSQFYIACIEFLKTKVFFN